MCRQEFRNKKASIPRNKQNMPARKKTDENKENNYIGQNNTRNKVSLEKCIHVLKN
jgi:hypothetical protein